MEDREPAAEKKRKRREVSRRTRRDQSSIVEETNRNPTIETWKRQNDTQWSASKRTKDEEKREEELTF